MGARLTLSTSDGAKGRRLLLLSGYFASSSRSVFSLPGALRPTFRGERDLIKKSIISTYLRSKCGSPTRNATRN